MGLLLILLSTLWTLAQGVSIDWGLIPDGMTDPLPPFPFAPPNNRFTLIGYRDSPMKFKVLLNYENSTGDYGIQEGVSTVDGTTSFQSQTTLDKSGCTSAVGLKRCTVEITVSAPLPDNWQMALKATDSHGVDFSATYTPTIQVIDATKPTYRPSTQNGAWDIGGWGNCDRSCGGGWQFRTVTCMVGSTPASVSAQCPDPKPATQRPCNTGNCAKDYYRYWDYYGSDNCPSFCSTSQKRGPQPQCRAANSDNGKTDCSAADGYNPPDPVCFPVGSGCSWRKGGYMPCTTGLQARILECTTADGFHVYDDDCLQANVPNPTRTRTCLAPPTLKQNQWANSLTVGLNSLEIYGSNFAPDDSDSWITFTASNNAVLMGSFQRINDTAGTVYFSPSVPEEAVNATTLHATYSNGNQATSGKVLLRGNDASKMSLSFTLLFLLSFLTVFTTL